MSGETITIPTSIHQLLDWLNGHGLVFTNPTKAADALHGMYLSMNSPLTDFHGMSAMDLLDMLEGDGAFVYDAALVEDLLDSIDL